MKKLKQEMWEYDIPQNHWVRITTTYTDNTEDVEEKPMTEKQLILTNRIKKDSLS